MEVVRVLVEMVDSELVFEDWFMKCNCLVLLCQFVLFYVLFVGFLLVIVVLLMWRGVWFVMFFIGIELLVVGVVFVIYVCYVVDYECIRLFLYWFVIEWMDVEWFMQIEFNLCWVWVELGVMLCDLIWLVLCGQIVVIGQYFVQYKCVQFVDELCVLFRCCG